MSAPRRIDFVSIGVIIIGAMLVLVHGSGPPAPSSSPSPSAVASAAQPSSPSPSIVLSPSPSPSPLEPSVVPTPTPSAVSDIALEMPSGSAVKAALPSDLKALRDTALQDGTAASWRKVADAAAGAEYYADATDAYRREAAIYRRIGDDNGAQVEELKAAGYTTEVALYQHRSAMDWDYQRDFTRARLEPPLGCYVGAFVDRDDNLPHLNLEGQVYGDVHAFAEQTGKPHASFFMYRSYGQPFPTAWVKYLKAAGAIPHIAFEPRRLSDVRDDNYLRGFVAAARAADWPIFIRFAGEMNGEWTSYHGDPSAYKKAFRLVYRAFRAAPKVALIWCPNTVPQNKLDDYYPGDDATDWVGVNMYNVLYLDNDPARAAANVNPVDMLEYVYRHYSARKPICIAEYAATHQAQIDHKQRADFAIAKLTQLYYALPARYPRVKLVDWYDCDNLRHARPGRQLNNYLLTDDTTILQSYARAVSSPYFLGAGATVSPVDVAPLKDSDSIFRATTLQAWVRSYLPNPSIYFLLDGRVVHATRRLDNAFLPLAGLKRGRHRVEIRLYDDKRRFITSRAFELTR